MNLARQNCLPVAAEVGVRPFDWAISSLRASIYELTDGPPSDNNVGTLVGDDNTVGFDVERWLRDLIRPVR